jgi:hypothetical protein
MIVVNVSQATKDLANSFKHLSDSQLSKSIVTGLNKTIRKGRTIARTEVKKIYNIPQRYMNRINHIPATPKRLKASIYASRKPIPMDAFNPRFEFISSAGTSILSISRKGILKARAINRAKNVKGVSIEVQRGKRTVVPYAFMIPTAKPRVFARGQYKSGNGSYGFMQRHSRLENDAGNDSVKPLTSVTIFGAIVNPVVTAPIINQVKKDYVNNLYTALKYQVSLAR